MSFDTFFLGYIYTSTREVLITILGPVDFVIHVSVQYFDLLSFLDVISSVNVH